MARYDGAIVDAHQHFWEPDRNPHPWLRPGVQIPFRYGNYDAIKRRYLPDDYRREAADTGSSRQSILRRNGTRPTRSARPATRRACPSSTGCRTRLWRRLGSTGTTSRVLAGQAAFPLVRSVRHKPGGPASPGDVGRSRTLMSDPTWRRGFALLAAHGLRFDLQTPWWNLDEAVELAQDFPDIPIILNHTGLPAERDPANLGGWRAAMARFAACPNAFVKVSGLGQPGRPWTADSNGPVVRTTIEHFGADRSMFGSNFPVDSLCATLPDILDGMAVIIAPLPPAEQEAFFGGTARRVYDLPPFSFSGE